MEQRNGDPTRHESADTRSADDPAEIERRLRKSRQAASRAFADYQRIEAEASEAFDFWLRKEGEFTRLKGETRERLRRGKEANGPTPGDEKVTEHLWIGGTRPEYCWCGQPAQWNHELWSPIESYRCIFCGLKHTYHG